MKNYIQPGEWQIVEEGFEPANNRVSESLFSIGNGKMGQRANFEEAYSGDSLQGTYVAGVYYPDKTRVGWWKNGYPEYFAKVPNATNWIGIHIRINGQVLDLATSKVIRFRRELNMKEGFLRREFQMELPGGEQIKVKATRFCSLAESAIGALEYSLQVVNAQARVEVEAYLDGDVKNEDANYDEKFWDPVSETSEGNECEVLVSTRKTHFCVATASVLTAALNGVPQQNNWANITRPKYASCVADFELKPGDELTLHKYVAVISSLDHPVDRMGEKALTLARNAQARGFATLRQEQSKAWAGHWSESDIRIEGDVKAQQAIRFNIFQLNQTYTGEDSRLNIGPKGFTGEKYGGSTYWDTEAYCLPFYQATAHPRVAANLLRYRYQHLPKAIENAEKLGFKDGAALYPMVTMNGEECHNEWEITFEEIHRNGAIAYAIYDYIRYTGDKNYLIQYGLEVLIGIARFWSQRITWSDHRQKFVMLGVTGPNEFENNVNNNWYTNKIAAWSMAYCRESINWAKSDYPDDWARIQALTRFQNRELEKWEQIGEAMYYPFDEELNLFLQQDGFLDKEQLTVADLSPEERPIVEHWSWDRILRSVFIKQADVLQGIYFFEEEFDQDAIKRHFDYYEPRTVHESSLSPCVHSILAARIGNREKAYEFYLRTARLDLDDYNNDTRDGLHITSMAGTWMSIVKGFAGMRVLDDELVFQPFLPEQWRGFSFQIRFRGALLKVSVAKEGTQVELVEGEPVKYRVVQTEQKNGAVNE